MNKTEKFIEALKSNILKKEDGFYPVVQAVVVDTFETKCNVKLVSNDLVLEDVMYTATEENEKGFVLKPKNGTNVLIGLIGGDENSLYVVRADEVESLTVDLSGGKLTIKNNASDVKQILKDIVDMVNTLTVSTGVGPSGTPLPPTVTKGIAINASINQLFK